MQFGVYLGENRHPSTKLEFPANVRSSNAVFVPIIYFFYPETGSRSLEEVDLLFEQADKAGKPWLSVVSIGRTKPRWYDENGQKTESFSGGGDTSETYIASDRDADEEKDGLEAGRKQRSIGSRGENV